MSENGEAAEKQWTSSHMGAWEVSLSLKFQSVLELNQIFHRENQDKRRVLEKEQEQITPLSEIFFTH